MTVTARCLFEVIQLPGAENAVYASPANIRTIIDKLTGTNVSAAAVQVTVKIVPSAGAPGSTNIIVNTYTIAVNQCYGFPEIVGQKLEPGDILSVLANAANAINLRGSGTQITT